MRHRTFEGTTMQDVLRQVRTEMGPDAYIVSARTVKPSGIKGMWERPRVEVTATLDPVLPERKPAPKEAPAMDGAREASLATEVRELKAMVSELVFGRQAAGPGGGGKAFSRLVDAGVDAKTASGISRRVSDAPRGADIEKLLFGALAGAVETAAELSASGKRAAVFMGPTGVGKTTTLAKLAALLKFRDRRKVGLITLDTYRMAAVDQLQMYARIMDAPIEALSDPKGLVPALKRFGGCDMVLIDTSGRNHRDREQMRELEQLCRRKADLNTYLVLSATTGSDGLRDAIDRYAGLPVDSLVFTKVDEGASFGNIFSALAYSGKPLAYITTGQRVPEDIEAATGEKMASLVLKGALC